MSGERLIKVVLSTYRHLYCLRIALGLFFFSVCRRLTDPNFGH